MVDRGNEMSIKYRCEECGQAIDCLDAMLTATYHLCPRCLSDAIRGRSIAMKRAFRSTQTTTKTKGSMTMTYREPTAREIAAAWQVPLAGRTMDQALRDRYDNYVAAAESLGWQIKTFEQWLQS